MKAHAPQRPFTSWLPANCLGWIALLTFASIVTPLQVRIVVAQASTEIIVSAADPGEPPVPCPVPAEKVASKRGAQDVSGASGTVNSEVASDAEFQTPAATDESLAELRNAKAKPAEAETPGSGTATPLADSVRTLSVEPGVGPILPRDRPAWVGAAADYSSSQHYLYVGSLPTSEESEADEALDEPLLAAVRNYIDQEVVNEQAAGFHMPVDSDFIRKNLIDDPKGYVCELSTSQGPMYQKWVAVRVTPEQREVFKRWHVEAAQRKRLQPLVVGLVSLLALVSASHLVLRRRHGAIAMPLVNTVAAQPPAAAKRSMVKTLFKASILIGFLMLPAILLITALAPTHVEVHRDGPIQQGAGEMNDESTIEVNLSNLHK